MTSSFLIAEWMIVPFAGNNKIIDAVPIGLAFGLIYFSHRAREESARDVGWRFDNFVPALRLLVFPMLVAAALILVIGWVNHGLKFDKIQLWRWVLWLPIWGLLQEYVMQGFINRRAQLIWGQGFRSVLLSASIFSLLHLPNAWLAVATLAGGVLWSAIYQRVPNLFAIALSHGLLSMLLASALPTSVLNNLRVGFKYFGL